MHVLCVPPETTPPCTTGDGQEEEHLALDVHVIDVRCRVTAPGSGCPAVGADYTGGLLIQLPLRITDH